MRGAQEAQEHNQHKEQPEHVSPTTMSLARHVLANCSACRIAAEPVKLLYGRAVWNVGIASRRFGESGSLAPLSCLVVMFL